MTNPNDETTIATLLPMKTFITAATFYSSISLFVALLNANTEEGPFMASGIKIGG